MLLNPNHRDDHLLEPQCGDVGGVVSCGGGGICEGGGAGGKAVLLAMGLKLGDRVLVNGVKTGVLRSDFTPPKSWSHSYSAVLLRFITL